LGKEKLQYFSASDIFVSPSLYEPFGIVLLEAMLCGLPVIATNRGGQADIIKSEKNGLLVPPADAESLANTIAELAKDANRRQVIGEYNRKDVKQYNISDIAKRYMDLFRDALSEKEESK
ncbi:MAG: glycosyltransferase, partial [Candidatus Omnitrophota bacterium]